jgi:hypothetical protein
MLLAKLRKPLICMFFNLAANANGQAIAPFVFLRDVPRKRAKVVM